VQGEGDPNADIRLRGGRKGSFALSKHADRNNPARSKLGSDKVGQKLQNLNTWNTGDPELLINTGVIALTTPSKDR